MATGVYERLATRPQPVPVSFSGLVTQAKAVGEARRAKAAAIEGGSASLRDALLTLSEVAGRLADRGAEA